MLLAALLGFVFGWLGSVPVAGPIAALVITRGIEGRPRSGVFIALGGALVEAMYAFLAFWGFSTFLVKYPLIEPISRGLAALVLGALGVTFVRGKHGEHTSKVRPRDSALGNFAVGASVCALNPTLIATWTAVVTTLYGSHLIDFQSRQAVPFAVGCMLGIAGWFTLLSWLIRRYRERFSREVLTKVIRVIGALLIAVALWFAVKFVQHVLA